MFYQVARIHLRRLLTFAPAFVAILSTIALVPVISKAQGGGGTDSMGTGGRNTIQGRIYFPSGRQADVRAKVKLESNTYSNLSVVSDADGAFRFRNVAAGKYTLVIDAGPEYEYATESIYIEGNSTLAGTMNVPMHPRTVMVPIYLQPKRGTAGMKPGVISAALASVPKAAADAYLRAVEALQKDDSSRAITELKSAILLHPQFPIALNELGVQYLKLGQMDKAADVLSRAAKLAPEEFQPRLNYGIALLNQKKYAQAEGELGAALHKNNAVPTAHMYLGIALAMQRKIEEAEKQLLLALESKSPETNLSHRYLAGVYIEKRDYKKAVTELETYLKLYPKAADAERAATTIKELKNKQ